MTMMLEKTLIYFQRGETGGKPVDTMACKSVSQERGLNTKGEYTHRNRY